VRSGRRVVTRASPHGIVVLLIEVDSRRRRRRRHIVLSEISTRLCDFFPPSSTRRTYHPIHTEIVFRAILFVVSLEFSFRNPVCTVRRGSRSHHIQTPSVMTTCESCVVLSAVLLACATGYAVGVQTDAQAMVSMICTRTTIVVLTILSTRP